MADTNADAAWLDHADSGSVSGETRADRRESAGGKSMSAISSGSGSLGVQAAWDPYEVWLTRVKQPRERRGS